MIYIIINDISKIGGLSKAAFNLYKIFKENNINVKIITGNLNESNKQYFEFAKDDIINLNLGSVHEISHNKLKLIKWYYNFYRNLKALNIKNETIISIETVINFLTIVSFNKTNKIIATEHLSFQRRKITQILKKILYPQANHLIVLTTIDKKLYEKVGIKNVEVIPNFIEVSKNASKLDNKNILFIAKLDLIKGVDFLIKIIKKFDDKKWKFTIVGDGPKKEELKIALKNYNVEIKGEVLDVKKEYLNADIFILTSRKEGFPFVLLEAKNYGLPIVSFDIPTGPKELIHDREDGFLVEFGDIDDFVNKLKILTNNKQLLRMMGNNAKKNVYKYSKEEIMKKWFQII